MGKLTAIYNDKSINTLVVLLAVLASIIAVAALIWFYLSK